MERPELFRAIGTEQAAVRGLWTRFRRPLQEETERFRHLQINLLTSLQDGYRRPIQKLAQQLGEIGLSVRLQITPGRHDKRFARGPGAIDMLLFHDEALRTETAPTSSAHDEEGRAPPILDPKD
jgi:hypothetical protein